MLLPKNLSCNLKIMSSIFTARVPMMQNFASQWTLEQMLFRLPKNKEYFIVLLRQNLHEQTTFRGKIAKR